MSDNRSDSSFTELSLDKPQDSPTKHPTPNDGWFNTRPIPVYIISAWCILQFAGIVIFMIAKWSNVTELVRTGSESMLMFVAKLLYPTILFFAGTLLVLMRKGATAVFAIYFIWGCAKVISQHINFSGYLSLALVLGIVVYCLRLQQLGRLK